MPNYRRLFIPGGTYFFTVNLLERQKTLLVDEIGQFRHATYAVKRRRPFRIDALVVLPDHLHTIWTLPDGDCDFQTRWRLIKSAFSRSVAKTERRSAVRMAKGERGIWQRRYWEHTIMSDADYGTHLDYCYYNPVKHGLVERISDWPYSTFHRDVRCGRYAAEPDVSVFNMRFMENIEFE